MCRWAAYIGAPIFLSELISAPAQSLIQQSRDAEECKTRINADGFGLAWYDHLPEPGQYRDVYPAWSDPNLRSIARQVRSRLFLAHVRASTGTATSRNNCHPFTHGIWSFMHNGQISGFEEMRKQVDMLIPQQLYGARKGATDSEALFLIALGEGMEDAPKRAIERMAQTVLGAAQEAGMTPNLRMSLAFSDGARLYAVRYASQGVPPSLYYRRNEADDGWIVVSEPLQASEAWRAVPETGFATFTPESVHMGELSIEGALLEA